MTSAPNQVQNTQGVFKSVFHKKRNVILTFIIVIFVIFVLDYSYYGVLTCGTLNAIHQWNSNGENVGNVNSNTTQNRTLKIASLNKTIVKMKNNISKLRVPKLNDKLKLTYDDYWKSDFNIQASDVIVFLHIQKTGGTTFGKHLVRHLQLDHPCRCIKYRKRCRCYRPNSKTRWWLFSRYSTGWGCGLHADWTELTSCVDGTLDKMEGEHIKRR